MRHVRSADQVAAGLPVHVFGAGAGGRIVRGALRAAGCAVEGFVDDRVEGPFEGLPVLAGAAFAERTGGVATVVIASRHWRSIGRHLATLGVADVVDGSFLIWRTTIGTGIAPDRHAGLDAALRQATGLSVRDLVARVAPAFPDPADICAALLALEGPGTVFVEGTDPVARAIRAFVNDLPGLHVAGHLGEGASGFVDHLDLASWEIFLAGTDPASDPVIVTTTKAGAARVPDLHRRGFRHVLVRVPGAEAPPAVPRPTGWPAPGPGSAVAVLIDGRAGPAATVSVRSALDQTHPDTVCVLYGTGGSTVPVPPGPRARVLAAADLSAALEACGGDVVVVLAPGRCLLPDAAAQAVAMLAAAPDAGVVLDAAALEGPAVQGTGIDLVDHLFGGARRGMPDGAYRRAALAELDPADLADPFALAARIAIDTRVLAAPLTRSDPPSGVPAGGDDGSPGDLLRRAAALGRLFGANGSFGPDLVLWTETLVRDALRNGGADPAANGPPPISMGVYDRIATVFDLRGQIDHALGVRDAAGHFGDVLSDALACQSAMKRPGADNAELLARQTGWAARHAPFDRVVWPSDPGPWPRPIRVGYLCPYATATYFLYQILPFVARHDRSRVVPFCYVDQDTPEIRRAADGVRVVRGLSDEAFRDQIRADAIDILVDLTGFGPDNRFRAMGMRCAPVQVSYANHAATTGVPNVDFILADAVAVPPEMDLFFTETVVRLPGSFFCFDFENDAFPDPGPVPRSVTGAATFGCFGGGAKFNDALVGIWSLLLHRTPDARLMLCSPPFAAPATRAFMERRFARHGIDPDRLVLVPGASREEIKRLYRVVDVSLDTWPYCGGNTIAESLMMGVPVVTLLGETFAARYGASLLAASGCADLIATSVEGYVATAAALATDTERLSRLRRTLRADMRTHGFSDSTRFAATLETAYIAMIEAHRVRAGG
jgi:hypothetical protein